VGTTDCLGLRPLSDAMLTCVGVIDRLTQVNLPNLLRTDTLKQLWATSAQE
jgi:hypothetical protein